MLNHLPDKSRFILLATQLAADNTASFPPTHRIISHLHETIGNWNDSGGHALFVHDNHANCLMADGHAESLSFGDAAIVINRLAST